MHTQTIDAHVYNMQGTFRLCRMLPVHAMKNRLSTTLVLLLTRKLCYSKDDRAMRAI